MAAPQLSILIPYCGCDASLEATLLSVLENRPLHCEVVVAHDGSYTDPYYLDNDDEVRFVVDPAARRTVDVLQQAITSTRGEVIHILLPGVTAIAGWCEEPLRLLREGNTGSVAPIIRDQRHRDRIVAAGWADAGADIWRAVACGRASVEPSDEALVTAPCLSAAFFRGRVLRALSASGALPSLEVAQLHWGHQLALCGWPCRIAHRSHLKAPVAVGWRTADGSTMVDLQQTRAAHLDRPSAMATLRSSVASVLSRPWSVARWGHLISRPRAAGGQGGLTALLIDANRDARQRLAERETLSTGSRWRAA